MLNVNNGVSSAFQQGVSGMQNSTRSMVESANDIVRAGTVEPVQASDIVEPAVNIAQQQHIFDGSAKIVKAADEALGALIDIET